MQRWIVVSLLLVAAACSDGGTDGGPVSGPVSGSDVSVSTAVPTTSAPGVPAFEGVADGEGNRWSGQFLTSAAGVLNPRSSPRSVGDPCVAVVGTLTLDPAASLAKVWELKVQLSVDGVTYPARPDACLVGAVPGSSNAPFFAFGVILPGTGVGQTWGFPTFEGELTGPISLIVGEAGAPDAQTVELPIADPAPTELPALPALPVGDLGAAAGSADTAVTLPVTDGELSEQVQGAVLSAGADGTVCVAVYAVITPTVRTFRPELGVAAGPWVAAAGQLFQTFQEPCADEVDGWYLPSDQTHLEQGVPTGVTFYTSVPEGSVPQGLVFTEGVSFAEFTAIAVELLDSPPPPPGG